MILLEDDVSVSFVSHMYKTLLANTVSIKRSIYLEYQSGLNIKLKIHPLGHHLVFVMLILGDLTNFMSLLGKICGGILSKSMESLYLVLTAQPARKKSTAKY